MILNNVQYNKILMNPNVPDYLKSRVRKEVIPENWSFIGTDFSGQ
jgi:hypothetical protein